MPHVSKVQLNKRLETELLNNLEVVLGRLSPAEVNTFLLSLLSKTERIMLAKRLAMVMLLKENVSQTQIAHSLGVTQATVSRMELFLDSKGHGYEVALQKLTDEKKVDDFKNLLISIAKYTARSAGGRV